MLMGGILPSAITTTHVERLINERSGKKKVFSFSGHRYEGHSWGELLSDMGATPQSIAQIITIITNFLVASASYGIYGGPRALEALAAARAALVALPEQFALIATRIIRSIRKVSPSYTQRQRAAFIAEQDPYKALKMMQFAPGASFRKGRLSVLPTSLADQLGEYRRNLGLRLKSSGASLRRARRLTGIKDFVPQYSPALELPMNLNLSNAQTLNPDLYDRVAAEVSDAVRARLNKGRAKSRLTTADLIRQAVTSPSYFGTSAFTTSEVEALVNRMYQNAQDEYTKAASAYAALQLPAVQAQLESLQRQAIPATPSSIPGSPLTTPGTPLSPTEATLAAAAAAAAADAARQGVMR